MSKQRQTAQSDSVQQGISIKFTHTRRLSLSFATIASSVAHFIDQYLVPPEVNQLLEITTKVTTFSFKSFLQALSSRAVSLPRGGGNFLIVFAPVTSAFKEQREPVARWEQKGWEFHYRTLLENHLAVNWLDNQQFVDSGPKSP